MLLSTFAMLTNGADVSETALQASLLACMCLCCSCQLDCRTRHRNHHQKLSTIATHIWHLLQVAIKVQQACAQLQQRLSDYEQQPTAGLAPMGARWSMQGCRGISEVQQQALLPGLTAGSWSVPSSTGGQTCQLTGRQLQPLVVLLMHDYEQAVREQCRQQCWQQQPVPYGWEAVAQAAAEQQMQVFAEQQMPLVMELLLLTADAEGG
jgi:hypothetical protein